MASEPDKAASPGAEADDGSVAPDVPNYWKPSAASVLPEYTNADQEYIMAAFSSGSCLPIRGIPDEMKAGSVTLSRQQKAQANRRAGGEPVSGGGKKKDVFKDFEYISSRYSLADEIKRRERAEAEAKRLAVSGKDFMYSDTKSRLKHEDTFGQKGYRYPHMSEEHGAEEEQKRRLKWLQDAKILHGPFVPSGRSKPLERGDRSALPVVLRDLHRILDEDWGEYEFSVMNTEDDVVVVRFALDGLDSEKGLQAYMNVLASSNPIVTKHKLTKVAEDWNSKPGDGFLYYMFRPPWVRVRITDAYFTMYPEERTYATGQHASTAGSKGASVSSTRKPGGQLV